jgi:hypothetical protein
MSNPPPRPSRSYIWRDPKPWKPSPPAAPESWPQAERKWKANNPKKQGPLRRGSP